MLIVGLGNPGKEYEDTFHNCGFRVLDALSESLGKKPNKIECSALTCVTQIAGEKTVLAKPLTYMNNSGEAVKSLLAKYAMKPQDMIVIYDDIDIPRYSVRVRLSGSAGTHNGMRSVVEKAGSEKFIRIRIGIGRNEFDLKDYVLGKISAADAPKFDEVFKKAAAVIENYLRDGDEEKLMRDGNNIK
ncbi:MAG: aminoacyl-tRNA hydrolase [Clostridia bacterium]|nr:aminoacyl-tRNA hydrolase [Clostridia bacterium]